MDLNKPEFQSTLIPPKPEAPKSLKLICAAMVGSAATFGYMHKPVEVITPVEQQLMHVIDSYSDPLHSPQFSPATMKHQAEAAARAIEPTVEDFYYVEGNGVGMDIDGEMLIELILTEGGHYDLVEVPDGKATR